MTFVVVGSELEFVDRLESLRFWFARGSGELQKQSAKECCVGSAYEVERN